MMYFSRVGIRRDQRALHSLFTFDSYAEHKLLWTLFTDSETGSRPFLYRRDVGSDGAIFYVLSLQEPDADHPALSVETKGYQPRLSADEKLAFKLRANPVVSRRDEHGKLHRHDVVMDAKRQAGADGSEATAAMAQRAGTQWLARRAQKYGFTFEEDKLRVDGYRQQRWFKRNQKKPVQLSTLDFTGVLTVIDPKAFTTTLRQGIGPAKGFGCGLLLVSRFA